jgi:hypothetical protein
MWKAPSFSQKLYQTLHIAISLIIIILKQIATVAYK